MIFAVTPLYALPLAVIFLGPIAIAVAQRIGESPVQHLFAVTLGASLAFMLPTSCRSNLLVTGAGGYRVGDYLRVGVPFTFVVGGMMLVALLVL